MTAEEAAQQILSFAGRPELAELLRSLRHDLSVEVIALLRERVHAERLRNAHRALAIAEAAEQAASFVAESEARAMAAWAKGNALFHHSEYAAARESFRLAESVYEQLDRRFDVAKLQINQLAALRGIGDHHAAIELAAKARATCLTVGEPAARALAMLDMNLGAIYWQLGELQAALDVLDRGRATLETLDDSIELARIDINRANVLPDLGRFVEAEGVLTQSRAVLLSQGYEQEAATADFNLGTLAYRRGQYQAALGHFERARAQFAVVENRGDLAMVDLFRSLVYRDLNLLRETVTLAADAERTMKRDAAGWLRAQAQINQGVAYRRMGVPDAAEQHLLRARRNLLRQGATHRVAMLDLERAYLALETGHPARARRVAQRVARTTDRQSWPALDAEIELLLARCDLAHAPPDPASARRRAERALSVAYRYGLPAHVTALWLLGRTQAAEGDPDQAWQTLSLAIEAVEQARARLPIDELSTSFMEDKLVLFADAARLSLRRGLPEQLLHTLDRAAAAPLPQMREADELAGELDAGNSDAGRLRELREQWHWQQSRVETADLVQGIDSAPETAQGSQMRRLEDEIAELTRRLQIRAGRPELHSANQFATLDEHAFLAALQEQLAPGEALLQYFDDNDDVGALVLTPTHLHLHRGLVSLAALQRLLGAWGLARETQQLGIGSARPPRAMPHLLRMYNALVRPLAPHLANAERLTLVLPPGLHNLPFAAFFDGSSFLVEQFVLTHLTAARAKLGAAGHADALPGATASALVVGYSDGGRLKHALSEAQAVQAALEPSMRTLCLLEADATGERVLNTAQQHRLLHLATHAVFRADNPMFSWIRLADTRLTVADLYRLTLPERPLVVLSACETGRGTPRGGGLLGMGRGFLAAGAAGLLVSLWPVVDAEAASLMVGFYRELRSGSGVSYADALARAQRTAIRDAVQPSAWAAFLYLAA